MAKEVTNPNVVPGSELVPSGDPGAAPKVDIDGNVGVRVMDGQPTRQIERLNSKGKLIGYETVLDKSVQFAQPRPHLARIAHHAILKGTSGKVLVFADTGVLLARFADEDTATKHLKACGLSLATLLANTRKFRGRDIKPAEEKKAA